MRLALVVCASSLALSVNGSTVHGQALITDFNTSFEDAEPRSLFSLPGGMIFSAETPSEGRELWHTGGVPGDAVRLADIEPGLVGSNPRAFSRAPDGGVLMVATTSDSGDELWRTDGTEAGTVRVADIFPGSLSSHPGSFRSLTNQVLFFATDATNGRELWRTDGTEAGTELVLDVRPGPLSSIDEHSALALLGDDEVLFSALFPSGWQLWRSDGTAAGTSFVATLSSGPMAGPDRFVPYGDSVVFMNWTPTEGREPWISDGTIAGTHMIADIFPGVGGSDFGLAAAVGDKVYLGLDDGVHGHELWVTDGTPQGTSLVSDLRPLEDGSAPIFVATFQGDLVFTANSGSQFLRPLFRTDGTTAGTTMISTISGQVFNTIAGAELGGALYFYGATFGTQSGIWRTDGINPATQILEVQATGMTRFANRVYITGSEIIGDTEIWSSDGTEQGTVAYPELTNPPVTGSSEFQILGAFRDRALFASADFTTQFLLFSVQAFPGSLEFMGFGIENPKSFTTTPTFAFFFAQGIGLSEERPHIVLGYNSEDVYRLDLPGSDGGEAVPFGEQVAFVAQGPMGRELYITDFTNGPGLRLIADLVTGPAGSDPRNLHVCGDLLYFSTTSATGFDEEIWATDGTAAGTVRLVSAPIQLGQTTSFVCLGSDVFFTFRDAASGQELWRTDGTPAGTLPALDLNPGSAGSGPMNLIALENRIVFVAEDATSAKLWTSDGTPAGTSILLDAGTELLSDVGAIGTERALFFRQVADASEVWSTDGVTATSVLALSPPPAPGVPGWYEVGTSKLVFAADDGISGPELWVSDGTTAGTELLFDMGPTDITPSQLTRLGNQVLFRGNDGIHGTELFAFPFAATGDHLVGLYGYGCTGQNGTIPDVVVVGEPTVSAGSFEIRVENAVPDSQALLLIGQSTGQLEVLPGCILWPAAPLVLLPTNTDASGEAGVILPTAATLLDLTFLAQWVVIDPNGTLGIASATRALEVIVGP